MIYLASTSPRRRELLTQLGLPFKVLDIDVNEQRKDGETPHEMVRRLAQAKARAGFEGLAVVDQAPVVGGDTIVVRDEEVLGKPENSVRAERMLRSLSGRMHVVLSGVAVTTGDVTSVRVNETRVWFRALSTAERTAYCATGEPMDKAGGYGIQGVAASFIERIEGSHTGVMGLPLFETAELLGEVGMVLLDRQRDPSDTDEGC